MDSSSSDAPPWRIHRQPTLLPGRPVDPVGLYLVTAFTCGVISAVAFTTYGLYVVREATLSPLGLILVGTGVEAAVFFGEVPTGVVADLYSRRLSMILGQVVNAVGFVLMGAVPVFAFVLIGHIVWGIGVTLGSGARQAWLADEVGEVAAAPVYVRAAQIGQAGRLAGIPAGVGLGIVDLQATLLAAGVLSLLVGVGLALTMTERGFTPARGADRGTCASMGSTALGGVRAVRGRPVLIGVLAITLLAGGASEALDRLWPLHLVDQFSFPPLLGLGEEGWFGLLSVGMLVGGIGATWLAGRLTRLEDAAAIARSLIVLTVVLVAAVLGFAVAGAFWLALFAYWVTTWARAAQAPLMLAWINRGLESRSRATVLSMLGQADALGQVVAGPGFGLLASVRSVRMALMVAGGVFGSALPLYLRAHGQEGRPAAV
ncbi:MAG: MFS transporter [Dehalococcoidia bacterium]|nr:MFS transporter [Dehalococcoidia bacterium]